MEDCTKHFCANLRTLDSRRLKITLFIPCFVDMCYPRVGISIVEILERLGHEWTIRRS